MGQHKADATARDRADDGGRAGVGFKEVKDLGQKHRYNLRYDTKAVALQRLGSGRGDALDLLLVHVFQSLREDFAKGAGIRDQDCQCASKRAGAKGAGQDHRPYQRIDTAHKIEQAAGSSAHQHQRGEPFGCQKAQGQGDDRSTHGAEEGHQDRLTNRPSHILVPPHGVVPPIGHCASDIAVCRVDLVAKQDRG